AQSLHRLVVQIIASRPRGDDVNAPVGEGDIDLLLRLLAGIEQRGQAGRGRVARPLQAVGRLRDNPFERRQGLNQRFVLGVLFAFGRSELLVYQSEQRIEVGRAGKILDERTIIAQRLEQVPQVLFGKKQQGLVAQHSPVVVVD